MDTRLVLLPEEEGKGYGVVKPLEVVNGEVFHGLSIGTWSVNSSDGNIHILLRGIIDDIIHEKVTRKGVRAELRAAEKDGRGVEKKPTIIYNPKTKRFKEVYPERG